MGLAGGVVGRDEEKPTEHVGQRRAVAARQGADERVLVVEQGAHRRVDDIPPGRGELDEDTTSVPRVGPALHEATLDEPVDPRRHRPARHEGLGDQLAGRELVGAAGAPQSREDVELPCVEIMLGEGGAPDARVLLGQPGDAGEDMEGSDVEVRALTLPRCDDAVDVVGAGDPAAVPFGGHVDTVALVKYLDIKIVGGVARGRDDVGPGAVCALRG
jgi:hypothetical protein